MSWKVTDWAGGEKKQSSNPMRTPPQKKKALPPLLAYSQTWGGDGGGQGSRQMPGKQMEVDRGQFPLKLFYPKKLPFYFIDSRRHHPETLTTECRAVSVRSPGL